MSETTTVETADALRQPILEFGRGWMLAPATAAKAADLGLAEAGRFGFWVNGRAGVLGEVRPEVAAAAIGFMEPTAVGHYWQARRDDISPWEVALAWFGCAAGWGREVLAGVPTAQLARLNELVRRVVDRAHLSTGMLFAGSTTVPLPGDPAGDATINLNVLRELRGGAHLAACHAGGLGPHATIVSTDDPVRGGEAWAETFGWQPPHPSPDPEARARIEQMTSLGLHRAFEVLTPAERDELLDLVHTALDAAG